MTTDRRDKDLNLKQQTNIPSERQVLSYRFVDSFDWKEFACGCGAAFTNIGITYPIYKMIFRQMLHGVPLTSAFGQLRHEGLTYLYRGIFPPLAQKTVCLSIMFGVYDGSRRYLVDDFGVTNFAAQVIAGMTSGTVEAILLPFERIQTLLAHSKFHEYFENTPRAFRYVYVNHGFLELYRGLVPVLWRNGPSNAIFFMMREAFSEHLPQRNSMTAKATQEFLSGALLGATISTIFYPLNVIKVAMQSEMGHKSESMLTTFYRIYRERDSRIGYFYRGCAINSFRSFMSWGIINTAYEQLKQAMT